MRSFVIQVGGAGGVEKVVVTVRVIMKQIGQRYGIGRRLGVDRRGVRFEGGAGRPQVMIHGLGL
jgi:hypothetical protein